MQSTLQYKIKHPKPQFKHQANLFNQWIPIESLSIQICTEKLLVRVQLWERLHR